MISVCFAAALVFKRVFFEAAESGKDQVDAAEAANKAARAFFWYARAFGFGSCFSVSVFQCCLVLLSVPNSVT